MEAKTQALKVKIIGYSSAFTIYLGSLGKLSKFSESVLPVK